jgi:hypothetical protein
MRTRKKTGIARLVLASLTLTSLGSAIRLEALAQGGTDLGELSERLKKVQDRLKKSSSDLKTAESHHEAREQELRILRRETQCTQDYLLISVPTAELIENVLSKPDGESSLAGKMVAYTKAQEAAFTALEDAVRKAQALPVDSASIGRSLIESAKLFSVHSPAEAVLISKETDLLGVLSRSVSFLRSAQSHVVSLRLNSCTHLGTKPAILDEMAGSWADVASAHYARMSDMSAKRMRLREALGAALSAWLTQQAAISNAIEIDTMRSMIDQAFKAERFLEKVTNWWIEVEIGRGPARGLLRTYQQYEGALVTLRTDLKRSNVLLVEAEKFGLPTASLDVVKRVVLGHKETLETHIAELEKDGWAKKLSNQKAFLDHYETTLAVGNPLCGQLIKSHRSRIESVSTLAAFSSRENGFMAVVDACRKQ